MLISRKLYVGSTLTDATSVTLADPTGTFGVRRTDTNAVVVASGTAMNHDGTGLYSFNFTDPAPGCRMSTTCASPTPKRPITSRSSTPHPAEGPTS